jgi:hypothetical protein
VTDNNNGQGREGNHLHACSKVAATLLTAILVGFVHPLPASRDQDCHFYGQQFVRSFEQRCPASTYPCEKTNAIESESK